jgi:hypothetical protein
MVTEQAPRNLLMIRPAAFGFNPETADSNVFQQNVHDNPEVIQSKAINEFNRMVDLLEAHEIDVQVFDDTATPPKPDVLFPNNWVTFHENGKVILYPMMAENRRVERRLDILEQLKTQFLINEIIDLSGEENNGRFLEGTGSLVLDYVNRIAYACRSPRTNEELVRKLCGLIAYKPIVFDAVDPQGLPVYHTNVMMCIGSRFAVVCLDAIQAEADQDLILDNLAETGHKVVAISYEQMKAFAGNMLEVRSRNGEPFVLLSAKAFHSLLPGQIDAISRYAEMLPIPIETIETYGGGSVRCMVAGIYLPDIRV